jgi:GGDEF domain-containing protein
LAIGGAIGLAVALRRELRTQPQPAYLNKVADQIEAGRKLAIYERETGLFAHWYVTLRGEEECARAARYKRRLVLVLIEPCATNTAAEWQIKASIGQWVQKNLRATDIAGYLGNGRYVVLAPETGCDAVRHLMTRLEDEVGQVEAALSSFPEDGVTYPQLWNGATERLTSRGAAAA